MRVLVVGMPDSVHLARWLSQFESQDIEFIVFPSSPMRKVHSILSKLIESGHVTFPRIFRFLALPMWLVDQFTSNWFRGALLAILARVQKPNIVHIFEFQNGGYLFLRARYLSRVLKQSKVILTPYGSDIFWFRQFPRHRRRIYKLLNVADALSCECERDQQLAKDFAFRGIMLPTIPAFGQTEFQKPTTAFEVRNKIMVKGYQNKWGRAINALSALRKLEPVLEGLEIHVFSCNGATLRYLRKWARKSRVLIKAYPKNALSHAEVQKLFAESLIYIGLSRSDGISASMIEAMANGAVPIQSNTSCGEEWIEDGKSGYLVGYDDIDKVSELVEYVISNRSVGAEMQRINREVLETRLNSQAISRIAMGTYTCFTQK